MKNAIVFVLVLFFSEFLIAQVGIGTTNPDGSSILDVSSDAKGFLMPRVTTAQRNAIVNPASGLILFNSNTASFNYFDTTWKDFSPGYKSVNATGFGLSKIFSSAFRISLILSCDAFALCKNAIEVEIPCIGRNNCEKTIMKVIKTSAVKC